MSKLVCNVAKFKGGQLFGMDIHIQRKTENHTNKDINVERSNLNYELADNPQNQHYHTLVNQRIKEGYTGTKALRKDATLACGVLISSDKKFFEGLSEEQERAFFKEAYDHLCEKYGKKNIISATVHKDETTPHLHAIIVPLTRDGRLSAKELFDRKALTSLHNELPGRLKYNGFNIERGEKNANVKRLDTSEFKQLRERNKISVTIDPIDVEPIITKSGLFKKETESTDEVAKRLTEKYVKPLTEQIAVLRTELDVTNAKKKRIPDQQNEFIALYNSVKFFGEKHVSKVLNALKELVESLNNQKLKENKEAENKLERERILATEKREKQKLVKKYSSNPFVEKIVDCGQANINFDKNAPESYYVMLTNISTDKGHIVWGMEYAELNLKIGDFVTFKDAKIESVKEINKKQSKGMSW